MITLPTVFIPSVLISKMKVPGTGCGFFKEILIKDLKIAGFEVFKAFKSFLKGKEPCQKKLLDAVISSENRPPDKSPPA